MDTKIVADSEAMAERIRTSLAVRGVEAANHCLTVESAAGGEATHLAGFSGLLFLAISRFQTAHVEWVRTLRATVSPAAKVVVIATGADHGTVLSIVRAGASDILNAGDDLDEEIGNFLFRLAQEDHQKATRGHVLTLVPCQASSDASVLAVNIAAVVAGTTGSCGLLDFHFRGGDLALLLALEPRHTIADLFNQAEPVDEAMFLQAVTPHQSGIKLLAGPTTFGGTTNVALQICQQIIALAQKMWPVVIINSEDVQHAEQIRAVAVSDSIVLTMRLDVPSLHRVQQHLDFLVKSQVPIDHIHVVAVGVGHAGELPLSAVRKVLRGARVHCIPDDPVAVLTSVNVGNPMVTEHPHSKATNAIRALAREITGMFPTGQAPATRPGSGSPWSIATKLTSQILPLVGR